jgi:hypothetical protein
MAKAKTTKSKKQFSDYNRFIIPSTLGGVIAWLLSGDLGLGIIVFIAVWIGNWIGFSLKKK